MIWTRYVCKTSYVYSCKLYLILNVLKKASIPVYLSNKFSL